MTGRQAEISEERLSVVQMGTRAIEFDREATLRDRLAANACNICEHLGFPAPKRVATEYPISGLIRNRKGSIRCDVAIDHENGDITLIEAKRVRGFNDATMAISQLLMYEQMLIDQGVGGNINLVAAVDGALFPMHFRMVKRIGTNIQFIHCTDAHCSSVEMREQEHGKAN